MLNIVDFFLGTQPIELEKWGRGEALGPDTGQTRWILARSVPLSTRLLCDFARLPRLSEPCFFVWKMETAVFALPASQQCPQERSCVLCRVVGTQQGTDGMDAGLMF